MKTGEIGSYHKPFPQTRWSLVGRIDNVSDKVRIQALNELLTLYLPALRTHLLTCLHVSENHADDILQGFVAEKVVERNLLTQANQAKGRFRNFLLRSFKNYVISEARRRKAQKRAPDDSVNIRFDEFPDLVAENPEIEKSFDVSWARRVISETIRLMQEECREKKRQDIWNVFECRIMNPLLNDVPPTDYDTMVKTFDIKSPAQASDLLITAKRMFKRVLMEVVRNTVDNEQDVEREIQHLKQILSNYHAVSREETRSID